MSDTLSREQLAQRTTRLQERARGDAHLSAQLRRAGIPSTSAPASSTPPVCPPSVGERTSALPRPPMAMPPWMSIPHPACSSPSPGRASPQRTAAPGRSDGHADTIPSTTEADDRPELLPPLGRWWFLEADVLVITAALLCVSVLGLVAMAVAR